MSLTALMSVTTFAIFIIPITPLKGCCGIRKWGCFSFSHAGGVLFAVASLPLPPLVRLLELNDGELTLNFMTLCLNVCYMFCC